MILARKVALSCEATSLQKILLEGFDFDWKQIKLEWVNILQGIKIGGVPILKPNPNMTKLEDYLREKEARIRAEKKEAERK